MACSTCTHTMHGLGYGIFHCPRCGTVKYDDTVIVPALVGRVKEFRADPVLAVFKDGNRYGGFRNEAHALLFIDDLFGEASDAHIAWIEMEAIYFPMCSYLRRRMTFLRARLRPLPW